MSVAALEGRNLMNAGRFKSRVEPIVSDPLGDPPDWIADSPSRFSRSAWALFQNDIPWLNSSHRILVGMASTVQGRLMAGQDVGIHAMNLLRQCLGSMGATPSDASKVKLPDDGEEKDDLLD